MSEGRYFPAEFLQRNDALHDRRDEMDEEEGNWPELDKEKT